jgi:hypothetical protein
MYTVWWVWIPDLPRSLPFGTSDRTRQRQSGMTLETANAHPIFSAALRAFGTVAARSRSISTVTATPIRCAYSHD